MLGGVVLLIGEVVPRTQRVHILKARVSRSHRIDLQGDVRLIDSILGQRECSDRDHKNDEKIDEGPQPLSDSLPVLTKVEQLRERWLLVAKLSTF